MSDLTRHGGASISAVGTLNCNTVICRFSSFTWGGYAAGERRVKRLVQFSAFIAKKLFYAYVIGNTLFAAG